MFSLHSKTQKGRTVCGFTLLETLVSISILGIALVAATAALQNSLQTSNFVKDQITAYYLAEDAMEYTIALRDAGAAGVDMNGNEVTPSWTTNLLPCIQTTDVANAGLFCAMDTFNHASNDGLQNFSTGGVSSGALGESTLSPLSVSSLNPLYSCNESGATVFEQFYNANPTCTPTKFSRKVTIFPVQGIGGLSSDENAYNEVLVTVTVLWGNGTFNTPEKYVLAEDLYNWQPPI